MRFLPSFIFYFCILGHLLFIFLVSESSSSPFDISFCFLFFLLFSLAPYTGGVSLHFNCTFSSTRLLELVFCNI